MLFPNFPQSRRLRKSESAFTEGCFSRGQVSSGIFQRVNGSRTSEVMRCAFSDVCIVLLLFSILLLPAFFFLLLFIFFFNVEGRKLQVVTDTGAS